MSSELESCRHQPIDVDRWFSRPEPQTRATEYRARLRDAEVASLERMLHGSHWRRRSVDFKGFRRISYRRSDADAQRVFDSLADQWRNETAHLSSLTKKITHPAYLRIISLGSSALPRILSRLEREPGYWFTALRALSGQDPVSPNDVGNFRATRDTWLRWGRSHGLI
jgi:hypothetical protein